MVVSQQALPAKDVARVGRLRGIATLYLEVEKGTASEPAVPMLKNFATASPDEFRTDLPNARRTRTRNITEVRAANVPAGIVKLRVIEDVEEFTPNLEMHCFIDGNHLR